jgi:hypothetical protein
MKLLARGHNSLGGCRGSGVAWSATHDHWRHTTLEVEVLDLPARLAAADEPISEELVGILG